MHDDYTGLRVLVTGGGSGIGHAIAWAALARGAQVAVLDLDPSSAPAGVYAPRADVADDDSVAGAVAAAAEAMGGIDIVVNTPASVHRAPSRRTRSTNGVVCSR